ncbi:xylose isomerase domain-containing protein [Arthrobacter crystallopoietes BAB-32]|uniref:Xylose isomerase domain-containing protein n=1 Tax=Arthrobacter crystallopoietes BAB-32 TaxID=1246476 RepID=N1UTJ1_9MICC|nr:sugar phosphate isomerase/epimerase family protein [Arthrobacter crystallopoietes]EMY33731.1 xylose isomerase domain-containing protein [Arthrobacter crystallopoietes BAB-32]
MKRLIGVNTWVWQSPLTDAGLSPLLDHIAALGFDAVELPLENVGDLTAATVREALERTGLKPFIVGAMAPGRELLLADDGTIAATQEYLGACLQLAYDVGAPAVCGPFYSHTGRLWRMDAAERTGAYRQLRENLAPLAAQAAEAGVVLGIEPLNRYETSLINTTEQALEALDPLLGNGVGLALDSYHLNIEERSSAAAIRAAGRHLVHLQVCGNDRGAPGGDQTDWAGLVKALDEVGYAGPLNIESFTAGNAAIATAASIWRPLAPSQDRLAADGLAFLRSL